MPRETLFQRLHARVLTDRVLRAGAAPAVDAREHRRRVDAEDAFEIGTRDPRELVVRQIYHVRIMRAADERAEQRESIGRPMRACDRRRATTKPVPVSGRAIALRGQTSAMLAVET